MCMWDPISYELLAPSPALNNTVGNNFLFVNKGLNHYIIKIFIYIKCLLHLLLYNRVASHTP